MTTELNFIQTKKTVSETHSDLRKLFKRYAIEDYEAYPLDGGVGYAVRYLRGRNWTELKSTYQPTKAMNLRVCYQVINSMFIWEARGVMGLVKGTAFMGADIVTSGKQSKEESFDEACAVLGVEPDATWEEFERIHKIKVQFSHPDKFTDAGEKKIAAERFKRIQKAYEIAKKVKGK